MIFFYLHLQADSSGTRNVHVKYSAGSTEMHNHKTSFIPKRQLGLPCLGTWLLGQISTTDRRLQPLHSFRIQQFCLLCSFWNKSRKKIVVPTYSIAISFTLSWNRSQARLSDPNHLKITSDIFKTVFWVNSLLCVWNAYEIVPLLYTRGLIVFKSALLILPGWTQESYPLFSSVSKCVDHPVTIKLLFLKHSRGQPLKSSAYSKCVFFMDSFLWIFLCWMLAVMLKIFLIMLMALSSCIIENITVILHTQ